MADYRRCGDDVFSLGDDLIKKWHPDLLQANVAYVFRSGTWPAGAGRETLANAGKAPKLLQVFCDGFKPDFIIVINEDRWECFNDKMKTALLDHELCHCKRTGTDKQGRPRWGMVGHDVEEFEEIIMRHGLWKSDLQSFGDAVVTQLSLFKDDRLSETVQLDGDGKPTLTLVK